MTSRSKCETKISIVGKIVITAAHAKRLVALLTDASTSGRMAGSLRSDVIAERDLLASLIDATEGQE